MTSREVQAIIRRGARGSLGFAVAMVIVKALFFHDYSLRIIAFVALFLGLLDAVFAYREIRGRNAVSPMVALVLGLAGTVFWTSVAWSARSEVTSIADWIPFVVLFGVTGYLLVAGCVGVFGSDKAAGGSSGT